VWAYQDTCAKVIARFDGHIWFTEGFDTADLQDARALLAVLAA
jgi:hypothetical protein